MHTTIVSLTATAFSGGDLHLAGERGAGRRGCGQGVRPDDGASRRCRRASRGRSFRGQAELLDTYLSAEHRDDPNAGCAATAFGADAAHVDPEHPLRSTYVNGVERFIERLAPFTVEPADAPAVLGEQLRETVPVQMVRVIGVARLDAADLLELQQLFDVGQAKCVRAAHAGSFVAPGAQTRQPEDVVQYVRRDRYLGAGAIADGEQKPAD